MSTHDIRRIALTVGIQAIEGFQEGSTIEITRAEDVYTAQSGLDRGFVRNRKYNDLATLTFTLLSGSPSNQYLNNLRQADKAGNAGLVPFYFADNNYIGTFASGLCWVMRMPPLAYSDESQGRAWGLQIAEFDEQFSGGLSFFGAIGVL